MGLPSRLTMPSICSWPVAICYGPGRRSEPNISEIGHTTGGSRIMDLRPGQQQSIECVHQVRKIAHPTQNPRLRRGSLSPSAPMTRSLCGVERLLPPKLGDFLPVTLQVETCWLARGGPKRLAPQRHRVLRRHGHVHWRPALSRDPISPHERY